MGPGLAALHADRDELQRGPLGASAAHRATGSRRPRGPPRFPTRARARPSRTRRAERHRAAERVRPGRNHEGRPPGRQAAQPGEHDTCGRASDESLAHRLGRRRPRRVRRVRRRAPGSAGTTRTTRGTRRGSPRHPRRRPGTTPPRSSCARRTDPTPRQDRRRPSAPRSRPWIRRGSSPTGSATAPHAGSPWRPHCRRSDRRTVRRRRAAPRTPPPAPGTRRTTARAPTRRPWRRLAPPRRTVRPRPMTPRAARARRRGHRWPRADPATANGSVNATHNTGCNRSMPNCGKPSVIGNAATNIGSAKPSPSRRSGERRRCRPLHEPTRLFAPGAERKDQHRDGQGAHRDLQGCHRRHPVGRLGRCERHAHAGQRLGEPDLEPRPRVIPAARGVGEPRERLSREEHGQEHEQRAATETAEQQGSGPRVGWELRADGVSHAHPARRSATISATCEGVRATVTPTASRASAFAAAVPCDPVTMAPAWPIRLPGGASNPAM